MSQKSGTLDFCYFDIRKYSIFRYHPIKNIVFWKEWYQDHLIWFGSIDFTTIFWNSHLQSLFKMRELFTAGMAVMHKFSLCLHGSMGSRATMYGSQKSHNPWLKCHENEEKIDNDVFRNYHRIKTTQPISMILVSSFLEDNVLSDEIKICYIFEYQCNKNRAFHVLGDTRYRVFFNHFLKCRITRMVGLCTCMFWNSGLICILPINNKFMVFWLQQFANAVQNVRSLKVQVTFKLLIDVPCCKAWISIR